ncbi:MAG: NifU family protein [Bacteroidia bacterium]|nr:NifU family protein [Bacteroidia bacterium]MDW8301598.1 NifU family protein [Bacteroidia bacterium]
MDLVQRVESILNTVRPYLQSDGGDVKLVNITPDNVVEIELLGSCGECNLSEMTMKSGIEQAIKKAIPEIKQVVAIKNTTKE